MGSNAEIVTACRWSTIRVSREQRRQTGSLMEGSGKSAKPTGGEWTVDQENRMPFGRRGPRPRPPLGFKPDKTTRAVLAAMARTLPDSCRWCWSF